MVWPPGTDTIAFRNLEGVILTRAALQGVGGLDTSGAFAFDTGAGFLSLDDSLALALGLVDSLPILRDQVAVAARPLPRLSLGASSSDQIFPVLVFDSRILSRVAGEPVLGLIGFRVVRDRVVWIDYQAERLALLPGGPDVTLDDTRAIAESRRLLGAALDADAIAARFRMAGDGKVLVTARITPWSGGAMTPWLTLVLDTGASKCVLFEDVVEPLAPVSRWRPQLRGLRAPTLHGVSAARLTVARRVEVRGAARSAEAPEVELAIVENPLAEQLRQLAGEPVHGLLGYSFLERYRVACDYPRRVLWLDPAPGADPRRASRRGHVGIQFERVGQRFEVVAVAEGSEAARAGIRRGDAILAVDGVAAESLSALELGRRLEGDAGTRVTVTIRRGEVESEHRLRRRRLF